MLGQDVGPMFYKTDFPDTYCPGFTLPSGWDNIVDRGGSGSAANIWYPHRARSANSTDYLTRIAYMRKGRVARDSTWITQFLSSDAHDKRVIVAWDRVYDLSSYYLQTNVQSNSSGFMGPFVKQIFDLYSPVGKDATAGLNQLRDPSFGGPTFLAQVKACMDGMFFVGVVDHRNDLKCQVGNYILLASSCILFIVISVKFIASLQFESAKTPEDQDKFVICQVPCYTEGHDSLLKTIDSMAKLDYDSQRKLLFVVCDGMIIGHGNDRPTPRIVLDILGVDPEVDPEPVSFHSVGQGNKQLNMAKVYSGLYRVDDHEIPFVVVVKIGKPSERQRPGNRYIFASFLLLIVVNEILK